MEPRSFLNSAKEGYFWLSLWLDKFHYIFDTFHFVSGNSQWDTQETEVKDFWHNSVGKPLIISMQSKHSLATFCTRICGCDRGIRCSPSFRVDVFNGKSWLRGWGTLDDKNLNETRRVPYYWSNHKCQVKIYLEGCIFNLITGFKHRLQVYALSVNTVSFKQLTNNINLRG